MLANLLPGLRDLRAPLAAGYTWLLAAYLGFDSEVPTGSRAHGIWLSLTHLRGTLTGIGAGAALTFGAYLLGAVSEAALGTLSRALVVAFTSFLSALIAAVVDHSPRRLLSQRLKSERSTREIDRALAVPGDLFHEVLASGTASEFHRTSVGGNGKEGVRQIASDAIDALRDAAKRQSISLGHLVAQEIPRFRHIAHPTSLRRQSDHELARALDALGQLMAAAASSVEIVVDPGNAESLLDGAGDAHLIAPILGSHLQGIIIGELGLARTQLLGKDPDLFAAIDRLRAEADLRIEMVMPLIALGAALVWRASWWAGVAVMLSAMIVGASGQHRARQSSDELIEAIRLGRTSVPTLDRLRQSTDDLATRATRPSPEFAAESSSDRPTF